MPHRPPPRLVNNLPSFASFLLVIVVVIGRRVSGIARDEHRDDVGPKVYFGDLDHRHRRRDRLHHHHHSRHADRDGGYSHGAVGRRTATSRIIISGHVGKEGDGVFETRDEGSAGIFGDGDGGDGVLSGKSTYNALASSSAKGFTPRIIGGAALDRKVWDESRRYLVSIRKDGHFCGATLVSRRVVLTAARELNRNKVLI
jgi:hypothetical protein